MPEKYVTKGERRVAKKKKVANAVVTKAVVTKKERRAVSDRRNDERRERNEVVADERRVSERRKVQRRRQIDPTTCEREYTLEEIEFMQAMDAYKRSSGRMFPTCSEILEVIRGLGYVRPLLAGAAVGVTEATDDGESDGAWR